MAKKKRRQSKPKRSRPVPSKRLAQQLGKVEEHLRRKRWAEAAELLGELERQYPQSEDILALRLTLAAQMHDFRTHQAVCRRLIELRPDDAELHLVLAGSYLTMDWMALALQTFKGFLARWPDHPEADEARRMLAQIEPGFQRLLANIGLDGPDALQLAAWHEQIQVHLADEEYAEVRKLAEKLLAARPQFAPALNNLSEACAREGDYEQAAEACRRVLAFAPDNIHATANLARYLFLGGQSAEATETARRLRELTPSRSDEWVKMVEALSYLGEDAEVEETVRRARKSNRRPEGEQAAFLEHLAGVAAYRQGREAEARRHWQTAVKHPPGSREAQANLDNLQQPIGNRHAAWPFAITHWLPEKLHGQLAERLGRLKGSKRDGAFQQEVRAFLQQRPDIEKLVPALLDRGDPAARTWALMLAQLADTPALHAVLRDFALSQRGPDQQRLEAAKTAQEAGVFPSGMVRMWAEGQWREVLLLSFEITDEPERKHSPEVEDLATEAHQLLRKGEGERAEPLLRQALEKEPDKPDLYNNLAVALSLQDRVDEAHKLIREVHNRFPDYWFGTIGVARLEIKDGRLDEATALLRPLLERKKMHTSEFVALATVEIELQLARGEREGARSWLQLWENAAPDHPELPHWRERIDRLSVWDRLVDKLQARRTRRRRPPSAGSS